MSRNACLFCRIYDGGLDTKIIYKDDNLIVFPDIRPASKFHFLIVTKNHIVDAKRLTKDDLPLLEDMIDRAESVLREAGADLSNTRYGFHWPPFHSVPHLHLHAISPASEMGLVQRIIFRENSLWFVTKEYVLDRLKSMP